MIKEHKSGFIEIRVDSRGLLLTPEEYRAAARRWDVTPSVLQSSSNDGFAQAATDEKSEA